MPETSKEIIRTYIIQKAKLSSLGDNEEIIEKNYLDSLGFLELSSWLENKFGIKVAAEDLTEDNFSSLNNIAHFVDGRQ